MSRQASVAIVLSLSFVFAFTSLSWAQKGETATWIDTTGKYKIQAEFVRLDGTSVVLLKADGTEQKVPLNKLNPESQLRAREAAKAAAKAPPPKREPAAPKGTSGANDASGASGSGLDSVTVPAVAEFPSNATAQQFMDVIVAELRKKNNLVLWDALPSSYQKDAEKLVALASTKLDPKTFGALRDTTQRAVKLMRTKKEFILGSEKLKSLVGTADLVKSYDPAVELVAAYLAPEILTPDRLKGGLRDLVGKYIGNIVMKAGELAKTLPGDSPMKAQFQGELPPNFKAEVMQDGASKATVTITMGEQSPPPMSLVNVDGRWLPIDMVNSWEDQIQFATQQLEAITPQKASEIHLQLVGAISLLVTPQLYQLQNAKTQAEFDQVIGTLVDMVQQQVGAGIPFQR